MGQIKKWAEINATHLGLCVLQAFLNLERGESGEVDVELRVGPRLVPEQMVTCSMESFGPSAERWLRIAPDLVNKRVVIFEIQKGQEPATSLEGGIQIGGRHADRTK